MKTLIIDNYDSFTYNLFQQVAQISGVEPIVVKNDEVSFLDILEIDPDNIIISPGPGRPEKEEDFGICSQVILESKKPILGVCLGLQGIAHLFGGKVVHAPEPYHGRLSPVIHNKESLFQGIPSPFNVVRYHSLVVQDLPTCLRVTATSKDGLVMGLEHMERPLWAIQFHPESILTEYGDEIIRNFLTLSKDRNAIDKITTNLQVCD